MRCRRCKGRSGQRKRVFRTPLEAIRECAKRGWIYYDIYACPYRRNRYHVSHLRETRKR